MLTFGECTVARTCPGRRKAIRTVGGPLPEYDSGGPDCYLSAAVALRAMVMSRVPKFLFERAPRVSVLARPSWNQPVFRDPLTASLTSCLRDSVRMNDRYARSYRLRTVVSLRNPVLYPTSLSKIGNLRPVLVGVRTSTEGTTCTVRRWVVLGRCLGGILWIAIARRSLHVWSIIHGIG